MLMLARPFVGRRAASALLIVFSLLAVGCNRQQNATVTGTVMKGGQPIAVSGTGVLQVTLVPDVGPGTNYTSQMAECDRATGKFQIPDVKPGKYKIGVEQFDPSPLADKLNGAFRAESGKIVREIDGKKPLTIDLAKPAE
jgi:hypothetical protein